MAWKRLVSISAVSFVSTKTRHRRSSPASQIRLSSSISCAESSCGGTCVWAETASPGLPCKPMALLLINHLAAYGPRTELLSQAASRRINSSDSALAAALSSPLIRFTLAAPTSLASPVICPMEFASMSSSRDVAALESLLLVRPSSQHNLWILSQSLLATASCSGESSTVTVISCARVPRSFGLYSSVSSPNFAMRAARASIALWTVPALQGEAVRPTTRGLCLGSMSWMSFKSCA
mmetsp:Transcript_6982/g.19709  ORF Transcript_6982/g.19709 Transcript_6982/m.19709 type:complete len:237 (+) Transcript_6982:5538-6248(+)